MDLSRGLGDVYKRQDQTAHQGGHRKDGEAQVYFSERWAHHSGVFVI
jgi:hypothetical protein